MPKRLEDGISADLRVCNSPSSLAVGLFFVILMPGLP